MATSRGGLGMPCECRAATCRMVVMVVVMMMMMMNDF